MFEETHTWPTIAPYKACMWPQCAISSQSGNIWPLLPLSENRCLPSLKKKRDWQERLEAVSFSFFFFFLTSTLPEVIMCTEWTRSVKRQIRLVGLKFERCPK